MSARSKLTFDTFQPISLEQWKAKVEGDLKSRPYADLQWELNEELSIEPFYNSESIDPLPPIWRTPGWKVGERITVRDGKVGKERWKEAIHNRVEAPILSFRNRLQQAEWLNFWDGYKPESLWTNLEETYPGKDPLVLLERWIKWLVDQGYDLSGIVGSVDFDPILDWAEPPFSKLADTIRLCEETLPKFRCVQINARPFHGETYAVDRELALTLAKANEYLAQLQHFRITPDRIASRLQFSFSVGTSYFLEIAKLRAFHLLWANLATAYGIFDTTLPNTMVHLAYESQTSDIHTNMIRASTQAMAGVLGGAHMLFIQPANSALKERSTSFTRRVARNVQHILKMESHLDKVADPSAGSYYLDQLTQTLAEKAWTLFQQIEEEGGFMESKSF